MSHRSEKVKQIWYSPYTRNHHCYGAFLLPVTSDEDVCQHPCLSEKTCEVKNNSSNCYYIYKNNKQTWEENRAFCKSQNLSMVKLPSGVKQHTFKIPDCIEENDSEQLVWLGGRSGSKRWLFVNGIPLDEIQGYSLPNDGMQSLIVSLFLAISSPLVFMHNKAFN